MVAEFLAALKQQLHAKADAQQGSASGGMVADRFEVAAFAQAAHAIREGTDAWKNGTTSFRQGRPRIDHHGLGANLAQCVYHAVQVA